MVTYSLIESTCLKIFLLFLFINLILDQEFYSKEVNDLEAFFSQSICKLLYFALNYNCSLNFYTNINYYNDILEINSNINLYINIKKSKLENIFLLLGIIPFLKNNSTLTYKIKDNGINKICKKILNKKIKDKTINLDYNDLFSLNKSMKKLLYYKWELIPKQFILNNLRHIINNYYNESNLDIFQKSLNMNYKLFIHKKKKMTIEEIKNLLSKFHY